MKNFLSTTAAALALTTAAYADGHTAVFSDMQFDEATNINATELVGMRVYASEASIANDMTIAANGETEWDDIGEINEILLTRDGEVQSVIVGVGGFLGIGEKDVAINMSELRFVEEEGASNDFFLVIEATTVGVQDAPTYEYNQLTNTMGDGEEMDAWTGPDVAMDGFARMMPEDLTTEDLTGAPVFGVNDEEVGEIGALLVTDSGALDRAVIDVGGFLGLGEREVAVSLDALTILRMDDGDDVRVYIDASQEALEQQPEYEG